MAIVVQKSGAVGQSYVTNPAASNRIEDNVIRVNTTSSAFFSFVINGVDYINYVTTNPVKTDRLNEYDLLDFTLAPVVAGFVKPVRGMYLRLTSNIYPSWFTGYITNDPEFEYLGRYQGQPVWGYKFQASSDEVVLNQQSIGIVEPFINATQGAILAALANQLAPGLFDLSNIQPGLTLARYLPDPTKKFSEIVKEFADAARYRFYAKNHALYFRSQSADSAPLTVDATSKLFTPANLSIKSSDDPIINEAVVLGDIEPQNYFSEYFVGDGLTPKYDLASSAFGVESAVLLDDAFQGSQIDSSKWTVFDSVNNYIQVSNGYLNIVGGNNNNYYDIHLDSASLVPIGGNLRVTHGDYDFLNSGAADVAGIVAGLWTAAPGRTDDLTFPNCIYGIRVEKLGGLRPVVNGVVDTNPALLVTANTSKRYIIRTVFGTQKMFKNVQQYNYINSSGVVSSVGGTTDATDVLIAQTYITEVDPATGAISNGFPMVWTHTVSIPASGGVYATYIPAVSNDLHCTITNITISVPMQASLEVKPKGASTFTRKIVGPNEIDSLDGSAPIATITQSGGVQSKSTTLGTPKFNAGNPALVFFKNTLAQTSTIPQSGDLVHLQYRRAGAAVARVRNASSIDSEASAWGDSGVRSITRKDLSPSPRTSAECEAAAAAIVGERSYKHFEGKYTVYSDHVTSEPVAGLILPFVNMPVATFGVPSFNEPIYEVVTTLDAQSPEHFKHEILFGKGLDDRLNKVLSKYAKPTDVFAPQDSAELPQYVISSAVGNTFAPDVVAPTLNFSGHGAYGVDASNVYLDAGQDLPFVPNLLLFTEQFDNAAWIKTHNGASNPTVVANNATDPMGGSTADTITFPIVPNTGGADAFVYQTVGNIKGTYTFSVWLRVASGTAPLRLYFEDSPFTANSSTAITVTTTWQRFSFTFTYTGANSVGVFLLRDQNTPSVAIQAWGAQLEAGSVPTFYKANGATRSTVGGFEVRYTDECWGADDGKNLVNRFATRTFSIPRNQRGKVCFIKQYDTRNIVKWSEDYTQSAWTIDGVSVAMKTDINPDGDKSQIATITAVSGNKRLYQIQAIPVALSQFVASVWVKGTAGDSLTFQLSNNVDQNINQQVFTLTGKWQKLSMSGTANATGTGIFLLVLYFGSTANPVQVTRVSVEGSTLTETTYCKTKSTTYGALSRYAAGIKINYPLIPPAVVGASLGDTSDPYHPKISVTLPTILQDVWGIEIRDRDNTTVLYKKDLEDATYNPLAPVRLINRAGHTYHIYTYNLLGEYSSDFQFTASYAFNFPLNKGGLMLGNGQFVDNTGGYGDTTTVGDYLVDGFHVDESFGGGFNNCLVAHIESPIFGFSGNGNNILIRLNTGVSVPTGSNFLDIRSDVIPVKGGEPYFASAHIRWDINTGFPAGVTGTAGVWIWWLKRDGSLSSVTPYSNVGILNGPNASDNYFKSVFIAPIDAVYAHIGPQFTVNNASGSPFNTGGNLYADCRYAKLVFENAYTRGTYLNNQGSLVNSPRNVIGYSAPVPGSSTTAEIDFSWSAFNCYRTDQSTITVPSGSLTFTGLNASTTYHFMAYVSGLDAANPVMNIVMSTQSGGGAAEVFPQTLAGSYDGCSPVNLDLQATTAAVGGSGGGGGGGREYCPAIDQEVETREHGFLPAGELRPGMHLRDIENGVWNKILSIEIMERELVYVKIGNESFHVEIGHLWLNAGGDSRADSADWTHTYDLSLNTLIQGCDGNVYPVREIGEPHWGKFAAIRCERNRFRLGKLVGHNILTY
jgi:hypothetical protein